MELRQQALRALAERDPRQKAAQATALFERARQLSLAPTAPPPAGALPGRPERPLLVQPAQVPHRSPSQPEGLAALLHAIAHIEFNAINLALDAAWRFEGLPDAFHHDWLRVAAEEAYHFTLLADHLQALGHAYGDFDAHDGLWSMCEKTAPDVLARMALVPRTLEARGLDATPQIQRKLRQVGSPAALRAVEILDILLRDEVGHVAIGNHWFRWLCAQRALDHREAYARLAQQYGAPRLRGPFNVEARRAAGFDEAELASL
jgi:uncharacterized ferritin-like protein (DUF455 family)